MKRTDPNFDPNYWGNNRRERFANIWHMKTCNKVVREKNWWLETVAFTVCGFIMKLAYWGIKDEEENDGTQS